MRFQKSPFSSRRKRSKIFSPTLAFSHRFHLSTLKRSKTMKTTGTGDRPFSRPAILYRNKRFLHAQPRFQLFQCEAGRAKTKHFILQGLNMVAAWKRPIWYLPRIPNSLVICVCLSSRCGCNFAGNEIRKAFKIPQNIETFFEYVKNHEYLPAFSKQEKLILRRCDRKFEFDFASSFTKCCTFTED